MSAPLPTAAASWHLLAWEIFTTGTWWWPSHYLTIPFLADIVLAVCKAAQRLLERGRGLELSLWRLWMCFSSNNSCVSTLYLFLLVQSRMFILYSWLYLFFMRCRNKFFWLLKQLFLSRTAAVLLPNLFSFLFLSFFFLKTFKACMHVVVWWKISSYIKKKGRNTQS